MATPLETAASGGFADATTEATRPAECSESCPGLAYSGVPAEAFVNGMPGAWVTGAGVAGLAASSPAPGVLRDTGAGRGFPEGPVMPAVWVGVFEVGAEAESLRVELPDCTSTPVEASPRSVGKRASGTLAVFCLDPGTDPTGPPAWVKIGPATATEVPREKIRNPRPGRLRSIMRTIT